MKQGRLIRITQWAALFGILLCQQPAIGHAQERTPLAAEEVVAVRLFGEISPLDFSPDSKLVAFMVRDNRRITFQENGSEVFAATGIDPTNRAGDIWVANTATGQVRNLTAGKGSSWEPSWSPDGHYLAFLSDRDDSGQAKVWVWDSVRDVLRLVSDRYVRAVKMSNRIEWLHDSRSFIIATVPEGLSLDGYKRRVLLRGGSPHSDGPASSGSTAVVFESTPVDKTNRASRPDAFNLDATHLHDLTLIDVVTGHTRTIVHSQRIQKYSVSPDGLHLAYTIPKRFYKPGSFRRVIDFIEINLETLGTRTLGSDLLLNDVFRWSPDGSQIAYAAYGADDASYELFVVSAATGETRKLSRISHTTHDGIWLAPVWNPNGDCFYFVLDGALWQTAVSDGSSKELVRIPNRTISSMIWGSDGRLWTVAEGNATIVVVHDAEKKQDGFYRVELKTGEYKKLRETGECYTCKWGVPDAGPYHMIVSPDGQQLVYIAENSQHPPDLWVTGADMSQSRRLTHLNPQFDSHELGAANLIEWRDDDGEMLKGALLLPSGYKPGGRYPLLVYVYRDRRLSNKLDHFGLGEFPGPLNFQLFSTRGYAVLLPDAREAEHEPLLSLGRSVLPGINRVIDMGIADPERIGVMGHSGGGYSTLALISQSKRFAAAAELSGWGNYIGLYGAMNLDGSGIGYTQAESHMGGQPWEFPLRYLENSPLFRLDRVGTPLLMVQGSQDADVASFLADEVFVGLRRLEKPVSYVRYAGESHVPRDWSYANQIDLANRMTDWFDRYLKKSPPIRAFASNHSF